MATDFIDQLRRATFPIERRGGYSPEAVTAYLNELADWLETGGGDQARTMLVQREMERIGERTGTILSAAQESADKMSREAAGEAARVRTEAESQVAQSRAEADAYANETRASADEYAKTTTEAAERAAAETRGDADEQAKATIREAESRLQRAMDEAVERTRGVEEEIAALVAKRAEVTANLEALIGDVRAAIDGPGAEDLEIPERVEEMAEATGDGGRTRVLAAEPAADADETADVDGTADVEAEEGYDYPETDELERERRRRSAGKASDQPTDESNLADLL
jgi:hypothetical protein